MLEYSYFNFGLPSSPSERSDLNLKESDLNTSRKSLPQAESFFHSLSHQNPNPPNTNLKAQIIRKSIEEKKELAISRLKQTKGQFALVQKNLTTIEQQTDSSRSTQKTLNVMQLWVSDYVLNGSASGAETGLPFIFNTTSDSLLGLHPTAGTVKLAADLIEMGSGIAALIYKYRLLNAAEKEVKNLMRQSTSLQPKQLARLKQLENAIKFERIQFKSQIIEQHIIGVRNLFSYLTFALSWVVKNPLTTSLTDGASAFIGGCNAALYGLFFYRAHCDLQTHREWSKDFKMWVKKQTLFINKPEIITTKARKQVNEIAEKLRAKRIKRHDHQLDQIQTLKEKLEKKEIDIESIQSKIKEIKLSGLKSFVENLKFHEKSSDEIKAKLEEKLGISLDPELIASIHDACLVLKDIQEDKELSLDDKQVVINETRNLLSLYLGECCEKWIENQSEDALLANFVDYHSVLDMTIKTALSEMVKRKHQIEKNFLKVKTAQTGIRFSAATIIFGVAVTLMIIGLATTPLGGAGLILTLLSVISIAISLGLIGGGYYFAYQKKPALTTARLKGASVKLLAYHSLSTINRIKENIEKNIKIAWQEKRDDLANYIRELPFIHRFFSPTLPLAPVDLEEKIEARKRFEANFREKQKSSQEWAAKATALKNELDELAWKDFAKQADLKIANKGSDQLHPFDTLEVLSNALSQADFNLLSPETKELLEIQLGIDIQSLQTEVEKEPAAFKQLLLNFFNLDDFAFVKFIGEQQFLKPKII